MVYASGAGEGKTLSNFGERAVLEKLRIGLFHSSAWSARLILLALVALAPWCYGGQFWHIQLALVIVGIALAVLTWLAVCLSPSRAGRCTALTYAMLGFLLIVGLQLVPLPDWLAVRLSSAQGFVREINSQSVAAAGQSLGTTQIAAWQDASRHRTLSILPEQTRASLAVYSLAMVVVWSASLLLLRKRWAIALLITLATSGLLNAFLGLMQAVSWNDWTLLPGLSVSSFSTFISRNSAPDYFATATGAMFSLLGTAFRNQKQKRRKEYRVTYPAGTWQGRLRNRMEDIFIDLNSLAVACISAAAFMMVATLATLSRGGTIACLGAGLVTLSLTLGARGGIARAATISLVLAATVVGILAFFELDTALVSRMDQLNEAAYTGEDGRLTVWKYTLASLQWYWLSGSGLGTYHFAILPFNTEGPDAWFYHAESLVLEIAAEMGLVGLAVAIGAVYLIVKKIFLQSASGKENLLLLAVTFSTFAILFHAFVDFRLILPGVFLPYAVLTGAFMGRCRRIESEQAQRDLHGENISDARRTVHTPRVGHGRRRLASHSIVAIASLLSMFAGLNSLRAFSAAERLENALENTEKHIANNGDIDDHNKDGEWKLLSELVQQTTAAHGGHAEVELQAGRAELLLWRKHANDSIDWGDKYDRTARWVWSNTQFLTFVLRSPPNFLQLLPQQKEDFERLRNALREDARGLALARSAFGRFQLALAACPLDERALWGMLTSDAKWLTTQERSAARRQLSRLANNNTQMLVEEGIAAIQEGDVGEGVNLVKQAVALNRLRLATALPAIVDFITAGDLLEILPEDAVLLAETCRQLASDPARTALVTELIQSRLPPSRLEKATAQTVDGWTALSWVAKVSNAPELRISFLRRGLSMVRGRHALRFELAQAYYEAGMVVEARRELKECIAKAPDNALYRTELAKWSETLDQKQ